MTLEELRHSIFDITEPAKACLDAAIDRERRLGALLAKADCMLKLAEWCNEDMLGNRFCPCCQRAHGSNHKPDCELAEVRVGLAALLGEEQTRKTNGQVDAHENQKGAQR